MAPPIVDAIDSTVLLDDVISASSLFSAFDPDDTIESYTFQDFRSSPSGGYFSKNGQAYGNGTRFTILASELADLVYIGGSQVGFEGFRVIARDTVGNFSSPLAVAKIYSVTPNITAPHVRAPNFTVLGNEYLSGRDFISGFDPDGYPLTHFKISEANKVLKTTSSGGAVTVTSYLHRFETGDVVTVTGADQSAYNVTRSIEVISPHVFRFTVAGIADGMASGEVRAYTEDNGYFEVDGVKMAQGREFMITAAQVNRLKYFTSGPSDEENIFLQGFDGVDWSYDKRGLARTQINANIPVIQFSNVTTPADELFALKDSFTVTDADDPSTMKEFHFFNTSPHAQNGELIFMGVTMPRLTWFKVLASEMDQLFFKTSRIGFEQQIRIRASDGRNLSVPSTLAIRSTPPIVPPTIEVNQLVVVEEQFRSVQFIPVIAPENAPLFSQTDIGNPHTLVEIYEPTADSDSGTLRNGITPIAGDTIHQFTKAEFDSSQDGTILGVNFYTGGVRDLDIVYVREHNESGYWTPWDKIDIRTEPDYENALRSRRSWNGLMPINTADKLEISYSFMRQFPTYGTGEATDGDPDMDEHFSVLTPNQQTNARHAFRHLEEIANVQFVEVSDTSRNVFGGIGGIIRMGEYGIPVPPSEAAAFAFFPGFGNEPGDMWFNRLGMGDQINLDFTFGSAGYSTFLHELGHVMGLKHPHEGSPQLPESTDSNGFTVMSYQTGSGPETSYQLYDIDELQDLYGANWNTRTGDDVYSIANTWGGRSEFVEAIWDAGGDDTLSAEGSLSPFLIDLRSGQPSTIGSYTGNINIAFETVIEHAIGNDLGGEIYGNGLANVLKGGAGIDMIMGNAGNDQLEGAGGDDIYEWGVGDDNDTINERGLAGRDMIRISNFPTVDKLEEDFKFRMEGNDLMIDLHLDGGMLENTLQIVDQGLGGYRIESLELGGTKIDLANLYSQVAPGVDTFRVIADSTDFGQLVVPVA